MGKQTDLFDDREDIEPPKNIVEYLEQGEDYPEDNQQPEVQTPETKEGYTKAELTTPEEPKLKEIEDYSPEILEEARAANMRTVIKRFDDIETKINKLLEQNYRQCRECGGKVIHE